MTHDPEARVVSPSFSPPVIRDYSLADSSTDVIRTGITIGGKMVMTGIFVYYMGAGLSAYAASAGITALINSVGDSVEELDRQSVKSISRNR